MQELFRKYLDNQCSPEEVKQLLNHFNDPGSESALRTLIAESLATFDEPDDGSRWQSETDRIFVQIKSQLDADKGRVVPFFPKSWIRFVAAALILVGGFAVFKFFGSKNEVQPAIVKTDSANKEIKPGGNKAILALADGSTVFLENAANGTLAKQGNISLLKPANGQLTYTSLNEKPASVLYNSITTPRGGQYQLTLSDGTLIWLNAASSVRFPVAFSGKERVVEVTGEVYFEVAKNPSMPFKIKIGDKAEVEVLGTHFVINSYVDEPTINTTLLEGSVKVTGLIRHDSRIIKPGEQAQLNADNQISVEKQPDAEQEIAWKNGVFNFQNASVEMALREIARWYDIEIIFSGAIPQKQFSGEMQRSLSIEQIIKILETNNVHCRIEGRKLIVQ